MDETLPGRQLHDFPGGLRLRHHKQVSCSQPVASLPLPERLYIPLGDHAEPVVEPGQKVARYELLASGTGRRGVPIHAPIPATVAVVRDWPVSWPPGHQGRCIELRPAGDDNTAPPRPLAEPDQSPETLVAHLREMGLTGLGGAMFPTWRKLDGDWPGVHTVILNGAECEPWIACDEMLMNTRPEQVIQGGMILARASGARQVLVAIEDPMEQTGRALEQSIGTHDAEGMVRVVRVPMRYPEGGERQLIQVLTGREVPHDGLPQDLGVVCLNVATAAAAAAAVIEGRPLVDRIVTVTGPGVARPRNVEALIGTPVSHLLEAAGGLDPDTRRLILGGSMSGLPLASDQVPVEKGTNCLLALTEAETRHHQPEMPCINCAACVEVCPAGLLPQTLYQQIRGENLDEARELNLFDCIECGCCAAVCPSHIPLVDYYRHGKAELVRRGVEAERATRARQRYEARQERLERDKAERRARREQRKQALADREQARDQVAAALQRAGKKKP